MIAAATAPGSPSGGPTLTELAQSRGRSDRALDEYKEWVNAGGSKPQPAAFEKYQPAVEAKKEFERNLGLWSQRVEVVLPHIRMVRSGDRTHSSPVLQRMLRDVSGSGAVHPLAKAGLLGPEPEHAVEMLHVVDAALTESLKYRSGLSLLHDEFWLDEN